MNEKPTHLDLFSGIGGFAIAFEAEGFQTIGFSEIEPYACKILKRHWPSVPNYGDIRTVPRIRCDIITGGFPCQPYSVAGKRGGEKDDRALWPEMCRVIADTRPAFVLGENVPGIVTMELDRVLDDLERLGYATRPLVIPACAVDARHRRDRVWIVAYAEGNDRWRGLRKTRTEQNGHQPANGSAALADSDGTNGRTGQDSNGQRTKTSDGGEDVADTASRRLRCGQAPWQGGQPALASENVSDADGRQHEPGGTQSNQRAVPRPNESGWCEWPAESGICRMANGIPNRSHRLRALGNAVVPQVVRPIAKAIYQTLMK